MSINSSLIVTRIRAEDFRKLQEIYASGNCEGSFETNDFKYVREGIYQRNYPDLEIPKKFVDEAEGILKQTEELGFVGFEGPGLETKMQRREEFVRFFKRCEDFEIRLNEILLDYQEKHFQ